MKQPDADSTSNTPPKKLSRKVIAWWARWPRWARWTTVIGGVGLLIYGIAPLIFRFCAHDPNWADFWKAAATPYGTMTAGFAAIVAAGFTLANGREQRQLDSANHDREHAAAIVRDLRSRFTTAAQQLASASTTIQQAGAYALASLADDWIEQDNRQEAQVCIDVLCTYLRTHPHTAAEQQQLPHGENYDYNQEPPDQPVRDTIIQIIRNHTQNGDQPGPWSNYNYDFTGAHLANADFTGAQFHGENTWFDGAQFRGNKASFDGAQFRGEHTSFTGAQFRGNKASFDGAQFRGENTWFDGAQFRGNKASFDGAQFRGERTSFHEAQFISAFTSFDRAQFRGENTSFHKARFHRSRTSFTGAQFHSARTSFDGTGFYCEHIVFDGAHFLGKRTSFDGAQFGSELTSPADELFDRDRTSFDGAQFRGEHTSFTGAQFISDDTVFDGAQFHSSEHTSFTRAEFYGERASFDWAQFHSKYTWFDGAQFRGKAVWSGNAHLGARVQTVSFENVKIGTATTVEVDWKQKPESQPRAVIPRPWPPKNTITATDN